MKWFFLLFLTSCLAPPTQTTCEQWAFKIFRGNTFHQNKWKKYCQSYKLIFTPDKCQKAFNQLALHGNLGILKKEHGEKVLSCFNSRDLNNFIQ